jgi:hypothetical protein
MTTYKIFYYNQEVGHASGESTWNAIDNFMILNEGKYLRKYLFAKPPMTAFKKSKPFKKSKKPKKNAIKQRTMGNGFSRI